MQLNRMKGVWDIILHCPTLSYIGSPSSHSCYEGGMKDMKIIGEGRHRRVFQHGNYAIKIPLDENGIHDNWRERVLWLKYGYDRVYVKYARCRLIGSVLVMQRANFPGPLSTPNGYIPWGNCPEWANVVDCCQVGYNRFGQIVAYDTGF